NTQLKKISAVAPTEPAAQAVLYENVESFKTPEGEEVILKDKYTLENYCAIPMYNENGDVTEEYTNYVVSARRAYAA
ncbi:MAG: hypothetical protein IKM09_05175, partial [Clostridia bacterium]|nr:hypothetical protein [Clostridia bacterium]